MARPNGGQLIAGVDEAGRGPLAGPVVAAAVILPKNHKIEGLDDSKKLSQAVRERLAKKIKQVALCWSIAQAEAPEIDRINILQATMRSMSGALKSLDLVPTVALIDGNRCPPEFAGQSFPMQAVVGGDALHECISAASILAKVHRDKLMLDYHNSYPQYGFASHKGYPTAQHLQALKDHGPIEIHRQSFRPVRESMSLFNTNGNCQDG